MTGRSAVLAAVLALGLSVVLAGCRAPTPRARDAAGFADPDPLTFVLDGVATPIGLPLATVPVRLELTVSSGRVSGDMQWLEGDSWVRFGLVTGTLEGDTGNGVYSLRSEDGRGSLARFELATDRRRGYGTLMLFDAARGDTFRYGFDAARRAPDDGRR